MLFVNTRVLWVPGRPGRSSLDAASGRRYCGFHLALYKPTRSIVQSVLKRNLSRVGLCAGYVTERVCLLSASRISPSPRNLPYITGKTTGHKSAAMTK